MVAAPTNQEWDLEKKQMREELQELRGLNKRLKRQLLASLEENGMLMSQVFIPEFMMYYGLQKCNVLNSYNWLIGCTMIRKCLDTFGWFQLKYVKECLNIR